MEIQEILFKCEREKIDGEGTQTQEQLLRDSQYLEIVKN